MRLDLTTSELRSPHHPPRHPTKCNPLTRLRPSQIVHETYYANTSATKYETDSLAKTAIAQLVGIAVTRGYLDLDTPIERYGVNASILGPTWSAQAGLDPKTDTYIYA